MAAALAAGVKLPKSNLTIASVEEAANAGVVIPPSHIHHDPSASPPDAPPPSYTNRPLHSHIPLPATMFMSTSAIHPKNFDIATAFVRLQDFDPETMVIPAPAPGESTAAVLYKAGIISTRDGPNKLHSIRVMGLAGLRSVLDREKGPVFIQLLQLQHLSDAPTVHALLKTKEDEGWACWPSTTYLSYLSMVARKMHDVHHKLLPRLKRRLMSKRRGAKIQRRLRSVKTNEKKVRSKIRGKVITPGICGSITRTISRVHGKKQTRTKAFLRTKVDEWEATLNSDLARTIVFV